MASGCAIPDLKPFADATATLNTGVRESGDHIIKSLKELPFKTKEGRLISVNNKKHPVNGLAKAWSERIGAMDALVAYSDSLANITNANANAKSNIEAFGNSIESLSQYIPSASAYSGDVRVLTEKLIQTGIEIKSYHSLSRAVEKAQGPLGEIADMICADANDLGIINKRMYQKSKANLRFEAQTVRAEYAVRNKLRKKWVSQFAKAAKAEDAAQEAQEATALKMLKEYDRLFENFQHDLQAINQSLADCKDKSERLASLLSKTKKAIVYWKNANDELAQALKDNRQPNIRLLVTRAIEIQNAVKKLR